MSEDFINKINIDYLINKEQYDKYILNKTEKNNKKDKRFYRKRILNLTKELLLTKEEDIKVYPDIKYTFNNFINSCIHYFKVTDNNDIIQEDYKELKLDDINDSKFPSEINCDNIHTNEEANNLLMRSIKINTSLDKFVKIKNKKNNEIILPQKKKIDLNNPDLKIKGIPQKKNINNTYEGEKKCEKETQENDDTTKNEK
jgi:hypothetical protein